MSNCFEAKNSRFFFVVYLLQTTTARFLGFDFNTTSKMQVG